MDNHISLLQYRRLNFVNFSTIPNWSASAILSNQLDYRDNFKLIKIGKLIQKVRDRVRIEDNKLYQRVTIRIQGRGVLERNKEIGKNIGTKNQFRVSMGQFIMSKIDARNGAFGIVPKELDGATVTQDFLTYNFNTNLIIPEFFVLITTTKLFYSLCQRASSGTTNRQRIDEQLFLNFEIPLPSLDEQKRLVDNYKYKILESEKLIEQIRILQSKKLLLFENEIGIKKTKIEKNKGIQFVNFKDLDKWGLDFIFREIKEDTFYKKVKIKNLCSISSGGTPARSRRDYFQNGKTLWVKTGELNDEVIFDTQEKITGLGLKNSSAKIYPVGSILIAMYGATIGKTAKLGKEATTNQACAVLFNFHDLVIADFLWIYIQNQVEELKSLAYGSAQPNINARIIGNFPIILPPINIQLEIVNKFENLKNKINNYQILSQTCLKEAIEDIEKKLFNTKN